MANPLTEAPVQFIDTAGADYDEQLEPDGESRLKSFENSLAGRDDGIEELKRRDKERAKQLDDLKHDEDELAKKIKAAKDASAEERAKLAEEQETLRRKAEKDVAAHPASLSRLLLKAGLSFKKNTAGIRGRARGHASGA